MGDEAEPIIAGHYPNVLRAILNVPWAIDHGSVAWAAIVDVLALRSAGRGLTDDQIAARLAGVQNGPRSGGGRSIGITTIPVYGVISPRQNMMARSSGGTTAESIRDDFRAAMADPDTDGIVFDIDSPGGAVEGMEELAAEIRAARGTKPIVAHANYTAASAAYWLASAADEVVASPSAVVASIGVFTAHDDISAAQEKLGIKRTVISAGKHKAEGALGQPLSDEARAHLQGQVDSYYATMTSAIAAGRSYMGRKVTAATVRGEAWGQGRGILAKPALEAGLVDRIATLEETVRATAQRVARGGAGARAAATRTEFELAASTADITPEAIAALVSGLPFADRLALASGLADEIAAAAEQRAELRAEDGRDLSAETRAGLTELASKLQAVAGHEPDDEADDDEDREEEDDTPQPAGYRGDLAIAEAALTGRYQLPS